MKILQIFYICLLLLGGGVSCSSDPSSFVGRVKEPAMLIDNFSSYQSIDEVKKRLEQVALLWQVREDSHLGQEDRRPLFDIYAVSVKGYTHLSCAGELLLFFFNNRLMETRFFPDNPSEYLSSLERYSKITLQERSEVLVTQYVRVWLAYDYTKRQYVGWQDIRLGEEQQRWIKNYS